MFFITPRKLHVVWNASTITNKISKKKNIKEKLLICISGSSPQKNTKIIFKATKSLPPDSFKDWTLIIVGLDKDFNYSTKSGLKIIALKYQNQERLRLLYEKAYTLLFPSLYESFGIPLVEALRNKCHIIASSGGATKEICDKNAFYFDPNDCEELISKLFLIKKKFPKVNFVKYPNKIIYNDWNKSINRIITIIENNFGKG